MRIAYTMSPGRGDTDRLLARLAARLAGAGVGVRGIVQTNTDCGEGRACDMDVQVLPAGGTYRISQSLGPGARGCRLDPAALEDAVAEVAATLDDGAEVLILNKFGKHEAEGRGFRDLIAEALARDIPVILAVNGMNRDAFLAFTEGLAVEVAPELDALAGWFAGLQDASEVA